jgi:hypothetical protein
MCELVPLTNAVAALMIVSALSGFGGDDAILAGARASVPTEPDDAALAAAAHVKAATEAVAATAANSTAGANDRSREHHSDRWLLAVV